MQFDRGQRHDARHGESEETEDERRRPASSRTLDEGVRERSQDDHDQCLTEGIQSSNLCGLRLGDEQLGENNDRHANGHVDPEDGAPADARDEQSPQHRPERQTESKDRAPHTHGLAPLFGISERVGDDGDGDRVEHRSANRLQPAKGDEPAQAWRETAEQRAEHEEEEADLKDPATAKTIGHRSREHQEAGDHE